MRKPDINHRPRVCIVCEGYEEEAYVNALIDKGLWPHYRFKVVNAKGAGNVTARFQNEVSADSCEAVLMFCDTDRRPFDEYVAIKGRLRAMLGQKARLENLVIYANPCSMQVILLHFGSEPVSLKTQSKHVNADIIEQLTGVAGYKAHQEGQIDTICGKITRANYAIMKERAAAINNPDDVPGSSNFIVFAERFEGEDDNWLKDARTTIGD